MGLRAFLLRFARDRDACRAKLRQRLQERELSLLDDCVAFNPVHLPVGSAGFVKRMQPLILSRQETALAEGADERWALREAAVAYGQETPPKSSP